MAEICEVALKLWPYAVDGCTVRSLFSMRCTEEECKPLEISSCELAKKLAHIYSCLEHFAQTFSVRPDCDPDCIVAFIELSRRLVYGTKL